MPEASEILKALIAIVVLINPLEGIPLFLARTGGLNTAQRVTVARKASLTVLVLLLLAKAGGKAIVLIIAASAITYGSLRMALPVGHVLESTGMNVLTRLADILVSAIALQMILSGLTETFPA